MVSDIDVPIVGEGERWWQQRKSQAHDKVVATVTALQDQIQERDERWRRYLKRYFNADVEGWSPGTGTSELGTWRSGKKNQKKSTVNPSESALATLAARQASQEIAPTFSTSVTGPDRWSVQKTAKDLERFVLGEWHRGKVHRKAVVSFLDGGILGMGAMKVFPAHDRIRFERTFPGELLVDEGSCLTTGDPRSMYQIKWVAAEVAAARFGNRSGRGKLARAINEAANTAGLLDPDARQFTVTDLVQLIEAWHLPSCPGAKDGRHVICLDGYTLLDEAWTSDRFPFAFFKWAPVVLGFYPQGLVERAEPLHAETNKLMERIQNAHHLASVVRIVKPVGATIKGAISNLMGEVIEYKGQQAPQITMPNAVSSEVYRWVDQLYNRVFEGLGISQLSAMSKKPAGLESGVALREMADNESGRFALMGQAWEDFHTDLAELTVECAKYLDEQIREREGDESEGYRSRYIDPDKRGGCYKEIPWSEVDLDRDAYELQVFPTSMLPHTPAGKLQAVQELVSAGYIDAKQGLRLLSFPDLESFADLATAALDDIDMQIEQILVEGKDVQPEPYQDLELALSRATSALLRARQDGAGEADIERMLNYITVAQDLMEPPPPAPGEMPTPLPPPQEGGGDLATPEELAQ